MSLQGYTRSSWSGDWRAALNAALLAIPQGMAYALVAGLPIQYGLLGSTFAAILGGLLGRDRFITLGPTKCNRRVAPWSLCRPRNDQCQRNGQ